MPEFPTGTVTFLFTDLEGSTRLWEQDRESMAVAVARHEALLHEAVDRHGGVVFSLTGDGIAAAFATAPRAVAAAVDAQLALSAEPWGSPGPLRARMGVHTGEGRVVGDQYESYPLNQCARLMTVAHGGQLVVSGATAALLDGELADDVELVDMGEHRLRDLQSSVHIFQVHAPGLGSEFPPLRSLDALPGNLPRQVTTFVGREEQIELLGDLVQQSTIVTLTGVGGVGKTRLALQIAADVVAEFPDGAWLCEFAPVTDPGGVWDALAETLRVQAFPGRSLEESVLEYLAPKRLLLVLDNCEHLLDAIARQVDSITQRCARVSVLATSREGLALGGERIVAVPSLGVPAADTDVDTIRSADAVQLFVDRASAAKNDFVLSDRNTAAVGVLCRRLDGIPLAIELAAARVRSMSPEDLVARLDQRFKLLTRGSRAALERHQTLRSTIDWSYDLLEATERRALDRLSVFAGSCDLEAAEAVLASDDLDGLDVLDRLSQLVDKSLVIADTIEDGQVRYRLLESIRQYAQERLQESDDTAAVRRRHADHYVDVAETAGPHLRTRDQVAWADALLRESDNFRAVLDWAVDTPSPEHALRLVAPLTITGLPIGNAAQEWAETASTIPGGDKHPLFPDVAGFASLDATFASDLARAEARATAAKEAQAAFGGPRQSVLRACGVLAFFRGDIDEARVHAEAWVDLARASGDPCDLADSLCLLAGTLMLEPEAAIAAFDEAVRVARDAGIASTLSIALPALAGSLPPEESERALALLDEAIEVGLRVGDRMAVSWITLSRSGLAAERGDWQAAIRGAVEAADQKLQIGDLATLGHPFFMAGIAFGALSQFETAAVLIGKADATYERVGDRRGLDRLAATEVALRDALGEEQVAALAARGAALETADAVAYLRAQAQLVLGAG